MSQKEKNQIERSLVMIKPDGVQRGLVGEIIKRFERKGLKIVAMKMVWPDKKRAKEHYNQPKEDALALGNKTLKAYRKRGVKHPIGNKPLEIAKDIQKKLVSYLTTGPVLAMVIEGAHAIQHVRKIRGHTNPLEADIGSITADLTIDSYFVSDPNRALRNMVHASGSTEEAKREIDLWFKEDEIHDYDLAIEKILYSKKWEDERKELVEGD